MAGTIARMSLIASGVWDMWRSLSSRGTPRDLADLSNRLDPSGYLGMTLDRRRSPFSAVRTTQTNAPARRRDHPLVQAYSPEDCQRRLIRQLAARSRRVRLCPTTRH